jgi:hypothetical protein
VPLTARGIWSPLSKMEFDEIDRLACARNFPSGSMSPCAESGCSRAGTGCVDRFALQGNFFFSTLELPAHSPACCENICPTKRKDISRGSERDLPPSFSTLGVSGPRLRCRNRLASRRGTRYPRSPLIPWFKINFPRFCAGRRSQSHLGVEPPSASGHAGEGVAAY